MAVDPISPDPAQGAALLEAFVSFLRRFVIVSEAQADPTAATSPSPSRNGNGSIRLNQADVAHVAAKASADEPCLYPAHKDSDWPTGDGRRICGVCHPPIPSLNGAGAAEAAR